MEKKSLNEKGVIIRDGECSGHFVFHGGNVKQAVRELTRVIVGIPHSRLVLIQINNIYVR